MWILAFAFWWELHVVAEESFEIGVIILEYAEGRILKSYSCGFIEDICGKEAIGVVGVVGEQAHVAGVLSIVFEYLVLNKFSYCGDF